MRLAHQPVRRGLLASSLADVTAGVGSGGGAEGADGAGGLSPLNTGAGSRTVER
jgi:hypothetical protein